MNGKPAVGYSPVKTKLLAAAAACPLVWLACFYLLILRTRLAIGHWPAYGTPDPKDTGFNLNYLIVIAGLFSMQFFGLIASALGLFSRLRLRDVSWWLVVAPFLTVVATLVYAGFAMGNYLEWLLD